MLDILIGFGFGKGKPEQISYEMGIGLRELKGVYETTKLQDGDELNSPADVSCIDVLGDFSQCLVGVRLQGMFLHVEDFGHAVDGSNNVYDATAGFGWLVRAFYRMDVAVIRPTWFTQIMNQTID